MIFAIVVNLFILCFFKYYGFLMDTINSVFNCNLPYTALALPIGISFYTFQALSYVIDVYKGKVEPQKSVMKFSLYLCLFPQLIAGPIIRYVDIEHQLENRRLSSVAFSNGVLRFTMGLAKKVLLANSLGEIYTEIQGLTGDDVSVTAYWIGILAYTLQIYFDFSGYSDMAIGLGRMFGFKFPENFNYPYTSKSVTEFWRRWHMSLGSWFREYLYIPLGGNRVSAGRHIFNIMVVWALTGLWHGANWTFVIWGLYYGVILVLEKRVYGQKLARMPKAFRNGYAMILVMIGWVIFSSDTIGQAGGYLGVMFGAGGVDFINTQTLYLLRTGIALLVLGVLMSTPKCIEWFKEMCKKVKL